jgi:hypothetical protein
MGEEKPDEELMGKRKSSPRLSTTFADVDMFNSASICNDLYMEAQKNVIIFAFFKFYLFLCYDMEADYVI